MKRVTYNKWLSTFDIEPLISAIMVRGIQLSTSLVIVSLLLHRLMKSHGQFGSRLIQASSIPSLIVKDAQRLVGCSGGWPRLLLDVGIAVLLLTPYLRVLASLMYFTWVERNRTLMLFTGFVLTMLTVIMFTDLV